MFGTTIPIELKEQALVRLLIAHAPRLFLDLGQQLNPLQSLLRQRPLSVLLFTLCLKRLIKPATHMRHAGPVALSRSADKPCCSPHSHQSENTRHNHPITQWALPAIESAHSQT